MANNKGHLFLSTVILAILSFGIMMGQTVDTSKKEEVNQIKKNSLYLYGEGVAETFEDSEKLAEIRFAEALNEYIKSIPELDQADVVIVPPVRKEMKKITFDRTAKRKVTFLYLLKSEIIPLMKGESINKSETSDLDSTPQEIIGDPVSLPAVDTLDLNAVADSQALAFPEKAPAESKVIESREVDSEVSETDVTEKIEEIKEIEKNNETSEYYFCFDGLSSKDSSIIKEIIEKSFFDNVREYLINRKATRHDIAYKGVNSFGGVKEAGYWIIFDNNKNVIAVLNKDSKTPIFSKTIQDKNDYLTNGKIWLKINQ